MNAERVETFRRLMDSQQRIAEALTPHGVTDAQLEAALAASEAALPQDEHDQRDFYLAALGLYTEALAGRLEGDSVGLRAVFTDVTIDLDQLVE